MLGLGVNTRVLMIGAHPDDEDTNLITWLSRGRHVTTAYLSLTRGDGGQNIIGNELGEALGVLRTEELLAARRIDGAWQYFTRAYDFGFSKDTLDTFAHWPRDTILGDVVRVVRAFRPHVIVAVFSGTPRDGHGQHQVSGILAREAYDVAGDTVRFPVQPYGQPWVTPKFYRAARGNAQAGTLGMDVGEYSPLRGESYGEIAGRSRSQHKSQAFGSLERKGPIMNYVRREATRVNETTAATAERSMFDGIDTSWARFRHDIVDSSARAALDSLTTAFAAVRASFDALDPHLVINPLFRVRELVTTICNPGHPGLCMRYDGERERTRRVVHRPDLDAATQEALRRVDEALRLASGVTIEATAVEEWPILGVERISVALYNRGRDTVFAKGSATWSGHFEATYYPGGGTPIPPGRVLRDTLLGGRELIPTNPYWLNGSRAGAMYGGLPVPVPDNRRLDEPRVVYSVGLGRSARIPLFLHEAVVARYADDVMGEVTRPVAIVPRVTVNIDEASRLVRAGDTVDREIVVLLHLTGDEPRDLRVTLFAGGLAVDSSQRTVRLTPEQRDRAMRFRVSGRIDFGRREVRAYAQSGDEIYQRGYRLIDYDHIRPRRLYSNAAFTLSTVDVDVPQALRVGYVAGVSDNVAPVLEQLGIPTTVIPAAELARADLSRFTTVVIGPRAYDANPELINANPKLFDFARAGGTVVVQYGQYEMTRPGYTPFPITINRPHDRVTHEDAPVTILDPTARELTFPNRITAADFDGWVQERSLYMPRTFDERYRPLLAMSDPGEEARQGAILVAPLGRGRYVYTSLAFFRQLPAGVPGATRLFVNLLSAGLPASQ